MKNEKFCELFSNFFGDHISEIDQIKGEFSGLELKRFADYIESEVHPNYGKVITIGAGDFDQKVQIEAIQQSVRDRKKVVFITGHNLPTADILAEIVEGVNQKHPDFFDEDKLFAEPIAIHRYNEPLVIPELNYYQPKKRKGHERDYKYHK